MWTRVYCRWRNSGPSDDVFVSEASSAYSYLFFRWTFFQIPSVHNARTDLVRWCIFAQIRAVAIVQKAYSVRRGFIALGCFRKQEVVLIFGINQAWERSQREVQI